MTAKRKRIFLTTERINRLYFFGEDADLFAAHFGRRVAVTRTTLAECAALGMDTDRLADHLLRGARLRSYQRAKAAAMATYEQSKGPALETYKRARAAAEESFVQATAEARARCDREKSVAREAYGRVVDVIWATYQQAEGPAAQEFERVKSAEWATYEMTEVPGRATRDQAVLAALADALNLPREDV